MAGNAARVTIDTLLAKKRRSEKIIRVVPGDYLMARPGCDGQSVNLYDLIGLNPASVLKFAKRYGDAAGLVGDCVAEFQRETREGLYPAEEYCYNVADEVAERIEEAVARIKP